MAEFISIPNGVNDLIIQAQLGHKDLRTTYNSYCYDVTTDAERYRAISASLAQVIQPPKKLKNRWNSNGLSGGAYEARTRDLLTASQTRSQLR